jgi:predicted ATPase
MDRPYIEELRIQNYGCIRDATFKLTPLHALIGPNDSGKSTVLRALKRSAPPDPGGDSLRSDESLVEIRVASEGFAFKGFNVGRRSASIMRATAGTQLLRLDPDFLRRPNALIPDGQPLRFADERGTGLAALYDALVVRDLAAYAALNERLAKLFPSVKSIQLGNPSQSEKAIGIKLVDGAYVPADLMSEGLLYYLAFAVLPYLAPTALLLVEEPENGLHPARIAEVLRVLRSISETTQVVLATHSPLVINELKPEEVTVVTRTREHGTKATPMTETANFAERSKVYALGELWLSYANGEDEAPLIEGGPRP